MGKSVQASTQSSYGDQLTQNLTGQGNAYGQLLGLEQQYAPQQTALAGQLQNQAYGQGVGNISQYAPQLQSLASQGQMQAIQQNPLYNSLYNTALSQAQAGSGLTSDQQMQATQGALQGLASAGRANSNQSIFDQILNRTQYTNQNLQQHLANANTAMSGLPNQGTGYTNAVNGMLGQSQGAIGGLSNFTFNPESQYSQNINDANQSAQMSANAANANMSNGIFGAALGGIGSILGGPIGGSLFAGLGTQGGNMNQLFQQNPGSFYNTDGSISQMRGYQQ